MSGRQELAIIRGVPYLIFAKRIPAAARSPTQGIVKFKRGLRGAVTEDNRSLEKTH